MFCIQLKFYYHHFINNLMEHTISFIYKWSHLGMQIDLSFFCNSETIQIWENVYNWEENITELVYKDIKITIWFSINDTGICMRYVFCGCVNLGKNYIFIITSYWPFFVFPTLLLIPLINLSLRCNVHALFFNTEFLRKRNVKETESYEEISFKES